MFLFCQVLCTLEILGPRIRTKLAKSQTAPSFPDMEIPPDPSNSMRGLCPGKLARRTSCLFWMLRAAPLFLPPLPKVGFRYVPFFTRTMVPL